MASRRTKKIAALVALSYIGLALIILFSARAAVLTPQQAGLMVVAMTGMYVGFGILIAAYRMISKLD